MKLAWQGRKIRPIDKNLFLYEMLKISLFCIFISIGVICREQLISGAWEEITYIQSFASGAFAAILMVLVFFLLLWRRRHVWDIANRQELARMILENNWFEAETRNGRKRITYFPTICIWYRRRGNRICVTVQIIRQYQEHLLQLEKKIETDLACELVSKEIKGSKCYYEFLADVL